MRDVPLQQLVSLRIKIPRHTGSYLMYSSFISTNEPCAHNEPGGRPVHHGFTLGFSWEGSHRTVRKRRGSWSRTATKTREVQRNLSISRSPKTAGEKSIDLSGKQARAAGSLGCVVLSRHLKSVTIRGVKSVACYSFSYYISLYYVFFVWSFVCLFGTDMCWLVLKEAVLYFGLSSNSGKWRFSGIPYKKRGTPNGDYHGQGEQPYLYWNRVTCTETYGVSSRDPRWSDDPISSSRRCRSWNPSWRQGKGGG